MPATHRKGQAASRLETLAERARAKPVDNFASISTYYRSADLLLRQAEVYRRAHNEDELYVMLLRFSGLVIETLPRHRAFVANDTKYQQLKRTLLEVCLPEAERLKANVKLRDVLEKLERQGPFQPTKSVGTVRMSAGNLPEIHWDELLLRPPPPAAAGTALGVPQPEGFDLLSGGGPAAAATAAAASTASWQPAAAATYSMPTMPALPELSTTLRLPTASQATLAKHALLPSTAYRLQQQQQQQQRQQRYESPASLLPQRPLYPELAELEPPPPPPPPQQQQELDAGLAGLDIGRQQQYQQQYQQQQQQSFPQPSPYNEMQLGPQEVGVVSASRPTQPLPPDATCCQPPAAGQQQHMVPVHSGEVGGVSEVKRLQQVRDVHVSVALMDEFMRYAVGNTRRNVESCGILAGTLSADDAVFTITTLIVPKQTGTSDTVEMLNEEEIFEVQDSRALYPLGWIHTHPSQTCFLSSVDVHTHCGFQTMLDEAVAIVMAPRDPSKRVGIFRLSTPGGLKMVQRCPQRGFHAHPPTDTGQPVYELCGHVYLNPRAKYEVIDLR
ncbi:hypothetical protein D9Q98_001614 [Chlorella vulgaris]|uniref:MPN domain-containing protein n=1 Tax=Chlorella vulgaris TaxID=3077 RepID=A0A9D4TUR3_CHLVU|nr:hypothetical protein D9Q98_001614 [Chlorella vulgaris]